MSTPYPDASTPDPSVHATQAPAAKVPPLALFTGLIEELFGALAVALGGINIAGFQPLAFLADWGRALEAQGAAAISGAQTAQATATSAITVQAQQSTAKPGWNSNDASADASFPITNIQGTTAPTLNVTATSSVISFVLTPDNGKKFSIIWLGQNTTNITGLYINLYKLDTTTGLLTLVEASVNLISGVLNTMSWNYYDLVNPINSEVGHYYACEIAVTGTGTYQIAGLTHWMPANTVVYPRQLGATRTTGLPTAPTTFTPTYSNNVPWFGLGGSLFAGPTINTFSTAGTYTYNVPVWMKWGDKLDIVPLGAGGGGQASTFYFLGNGGDAGTWQPQTLVYGVDIPVTTTTLTVTVGAGGAGGTSAGQIGATGGDSSVSGTGAPTVTGVGGSGRMGGDTTGHGPGPLTFNGVTYAGGGNVGAGTTGASPGGGGGGGGAYGAGGHGADGKVIITAYQAGTSP